MFRSADVAATGDATFEQLCLPAPLLRGVQRAGYARPSPVQVAALPPGRSGADLVVRVITHHLYQSKLCMCYFHFPLTPWVYFLFDISLAPDSSQEWHWQNCRLCPRALGTPGRGQPGPTSMRGGAN
jgi:hypothetical protein